MSSNMFYSFMRIIITVLIIVLSAFLYFCMKLADESAHTTTALEITRNFMKINKALAAATLIAYSDKLSPPMGKLYPKSFEYSILTGLSDPDFNGGFVVFSSDVKNNSLNYVAISGWKSLSINEINYLVMKGANLRHVLRDNLFKYASSFGLYKDTYSGRYSEKGDEIVFYPSSSLIFSMNGWEQSLVDGKKQTRQYWNTARALRIYRSIPRSTKSVVVFVQKNSVSRLGTGSSIRSAVSAALPGDSPFPSSDITQLSVSTHGAYRLHEVNADVFSDDLAFIRTTLTKLEHLDLSQARFYNDTVPISAFDCSSNIEYAFNLPKGNLPQLARIDLPSSVISVDWYAFRNLRALRSIHLPNVRYIAGQAFEGCLSLDAVHLPDVESIGQGAFFRCESLKGLVLPQLKRVDSCAFVYSGVKCIGVPYAASMDTGTFSKGYLNQENPLPLLHGLLLLPNSGESTNLFLFNQLVKVDVFCNTPLDLLNDFPPGSRQSGYVLPSLQPQWPATVFHLKTGEAVTLPVQFKNPCVSPGWVWGNSDNPRGAVFESGILKAIAPGEATVTVTGMTAAVTLQGAQMEHTFSNWPVPMHEPVQIKVTVQAY